MAGVKLEKVSKVFASRNGRVEAVKSLDLQISDGEFLVLVGPSGCGKTTTMRMIAGLEIPTEGEIYIGERRVTRLHPKERNIAMVFQEYALYPHMTVLQNLSFALRNLKYSQEVIQQRVQSATEMMGITELLHRKPKELSGGQRQRVALGRAIVRNPDVFLFDEPLSNLDAKLRVQMRIELTELHKRLGITSVYVTHDQVEAMTMGDRIVVLNRGEVQQVGTPRDVYHSPENQFVASFMGSPPMNFISGEVLLEDDVPTFASKIFSYALKPDLWGDCRVIVGKQVVFGVRPEHLTLCNANGLEADHPSVMGDILVNEMVGADSILYLKMEDTIIAVRVNDTDVYHSGRQVECTFEPGARLFLFDRSSGERVATASLCMV